MNASQSSQNVSSVPKHFSESVKDQCVESQSDQTSDLRPVSCENSQLKIQSFKKSQIQDLLQMNVYELLNKCDELISQHSLQNSQSVLKSSVNFVEGSFQESLSISCSQCKYHLQKELQWIKEKIRLQKIIEELQINIKQEGHINQKQTKIQRQTNCQSVQNHNLAISPEVFSLSIKDFIQQDFIVSCISSNTTSIIRSEQSQLEMASEKQVLLDSIKNFDKKLTESETENKYLKIENRSLLKTKSQIQNLKRQIQRTKRQRDTFKRKLIVLTEQQSQTQQKPYRIQTEKTIPAGLKQRGNETKKKSDTLFELSLTDASSVLEHKNSHNQFAKQFRKLQRINLISQSKEK